MNHPGLVILAPQLQVSKCPGAGMPEVWSPYLLKLVPSILTQICCSSTSYMLVRVSTYRNNVRSMVGRVKVPHSCTLSTYCFRSHFSALAGPWTPCYSCLAPFTRISFIKIKPFNVLFPAVIMTDEGNKNFKEIIRDTGILLVVRVGV